MISEIKDSQSVLQSQSAGAQSKAKQASTAAQPETAKATDTVELGAPQRNASTYTRQSRKLSSSDIETIKTAADQKYANLRALVEQMLKGQTKASGKTSRSQSSSLHAVDPAQQAISEDGEFGVKAVSDRIVKFAIAISGGDKAKYDELKASIDKGFQQATKSLGGTLPDISQQTYKEVMRKLDDWKDGNDDLA
jgi:hypothetical protein